MPPKKNLVVDAKTNKDVYKPEEEVELAVSVTNKGLSPLELVFASAQRYDFIVSKAGKEVWRWSRDRMFAAILESLTLDTGEKRTYKETWRPLGLTPGDYTVTGLITSRPRHKATCTFQIEK